MNPQVHFLLNKALESLGNSNLDSAELYLNQASKLQAKNPHVLGLLGIVFAQRGQYTDALKYLRNSLQILPRNPITLNNLGKTYIELKDYENALDVYKKLAKLDPNFGEAWSNIGNALQELNRFEDAIIHYDKALSLKPDYAKGYINKGNALIEIKRFKEAIEHYDKALSLNPEYAEAHSGMGNALYELKQFDAALLCHNKAIDLKPDYAAGWLNKGITLNELKRFNDVVICYGKALNLNPDIYWAYGSLTHFRMKIASWSDISESLEVISKKVKCNHKVADPFVILSLIDDPLLHLQATKIYTQHFFSSNLILSPLPKYSKRKRVRIAYFSPDFRSHPVSYLCSELFELHDRSKFEVLAFSLQKAPVDDQMNSRLKNIFDEFIEVDHLSDLEVAQLVRNYEIDIAVDLSGHTKHSRLGIFSYRVAPIQVNWLGYPGTTGSKFMDYIVADKTIIPTSNQPFYSEKVAYLPNSYMVDDSKRIPSEKIFSREEFGLPLNTFIFCCFNNDFKFNPCVLDRWAKILLTVQNSVLWISENNEYFKSNIVAELEDRNIHSSRIIFARQINSMNDYLARYKLADLFLDTHPYGAHTTALDSLKAGVPVLTLMGQSFASRVAASLLNSIGLPELIASRPEEYEAIAISLAIEPKKFEAIKLKLANNLRTMPLFNTSLFANNLESIYLKMYERYQLDLQPDHIFD